MARQQKITLAGTLNNLIFYESWGKPHVRTKPVKVRQTKATKASAQKFGKAVQVSRVLREGISSILPEHKKRKLMHRVNDVIIQTLSDKYPLDTSLIKDLEFYDDRSFKGEFKVKLSVEWNNKDVTINIPGYIPAKDIIAPRSTKMVQLKLAVTGCELKNFVITDSKSITINIPYNNEKIPPQQVVLPFVTKAGSLSIVAAVLENGINKKINPDSKPPRQWNPAAIIEACSK